ncbi:MAG: efflux RND transporter periplasmic adaptor subunit, partial [Kiritimatiellae bacterium]|nr:efflux RND transporter periplasmic adaptor subunit [Kiritimatiellia bacterium]
MRKILFWIGFLMLIGGACWWWWQRPQPVQAAIAYKMAAVSRGQTVQTIRATGTIEPEDLIDIGAQITGQIMAFGTDTNGKEVDYCSEVKKGQLLARIDDVTYKAEVTISKANLTTAKAQLAGAQADVAQLKARLRQAEREWNRARQLGVGDAVSQKDYDAYLSAYEVALANQKVGEAKIEQAEAAIAQAQAQLEKAERNLSYCDILSTVDGIIIDRRVNIGQTVTASMSTPSLFLVAKDLRRIEIWVPVNEADIGEIKVGQRVRFTVDAFPEREFEGAVARIRLNASMSSNVVTYTVEVATENPDSLLLPYLTANVRFVLAESPENALLVPAAA